MASQAIESYRVGAEIHHGDAICKEKSIALLKELGLPTGFLPLEEIKEFGYNRSAGFIWLIQNKKLEHTFKKLKKTMSYATEVTAFVEPYKMKKMTGFKGKELFLWLSIVEMHIEDPSSGMVTFKTGTGLSGSVVASAFDLGG